MFCFIVAFPCTVGVGEFQEEIGRHEETTEASHFAVCTRDSTEYQDVKIAHPTYDARSPPAVDRKPLQHISTDDLKFRSHLSRVLAPTLSSVSSGE